MGYWFKDKDTGEKKYSPGVGEVFLDGVGGAVGAVGDLLGKGAMFFVIAGGILVILAVVVFFLLHYWGILKANYHITLTGSDTAAYQSQEVSAVMVSHDKKSKVTEAVFAADGIAEFQAAGLEVSLYLAYDQMMYDYGCYVEPGIFGTPVDLNAPLVPSRAALVSFVDSKGKALAVDSLTILDESQTQIGCCMVDEGLYAFCLPEEADGMMLTFVVPGYEQVSITEDWEAYRLGRLEVRLDAQ